jgi:prepilin-type processing-associated H-X9-DG protein
LRKIASSANVYFYDGSVESIGVDVKYDYYQTFKAMLLERYGPPTKIARSEVVTGTGAKIPIEILEWSGLQNELILIERSGRVDQTQMLFSNRAMRERKQGAAQNKVKEDASKF